MLKLNKISKISLRVTNLGINFPNIHSLADKVNYTPYLINKLKKK